MTRGRKQGVAVFAKQLAATRSVAVVVLSGAVLAASAGCPSPTAAATPVFVISQVYGGGGNTGAALKNDFIELYNRGTVAGSLDGWTVQYASATGTTWQKTVLSGTVAAGAHYLVAEAAGAGGTTELPTPDASGTIPMSATSGKVALVPSTTLLSGSCPWDGIVDLLGYGSADCAEGTAVGALDNTTVAMRKDGGAWDSDDNAADFLVGAPVPRNSGSPSDTGPHVATTVPDDRASNHAPSANLAVTFDEDVVVAPGAFALDCSLSGMPSLAISGGPRTYVIDPQVDLVDEDWCTLAITGAAVSDLDTIDPPDTMAVDAWVSFSVSADQEGPLASAPWASLRTGVSLSGTGIAATIRWGGSDPGGGAVAGWELERSRNGGAYVLIAEGPETSATVTLPSSGTIAFRVRGIDAVGNRGEWASGPAYAPRLVQQSSSAIRYGRTWTTVKSSAYSGGSLRYAKAPGASALYTLRGYAVAFVTTRASTRGKFRPSISGVARSAVDTYSTRTRYRSQVWAASWRTSGTRTLKFTVLGTSGRPRVDLDALAVLLAAP